MTSLTDWLLTNLITYGPPILFVVAYVGSLGIPIPISLIIIATGAFSRQGVLDWRVSLVICLAGALLADNSEYLIGHKASNWLDRKFGQRSVWLRAIDTFKQQGGWAILFTRFWLTPLAPAVNLIAGSKYPYGRFLVIDTLGELLWVLLYGGLGYIFGDAWEAVSQFVSAFSGLSIGLVVLAAGIYFLVRRQRKKAK